MPTALEFVPRHFFVAMLHTATEENIHPPLKRYQVKLHLKSGYVRPYKCCLTRDFQAPNKGVLELSNEVLHIPIPQRAAELQVLKE